MKTPLFLRAFLGGIFWLPKRAAKIIFTPSPRGKVRWALFAIVVIAIGLAMVDFPAQYNVLANKVHLPTITERDFRLGLDLQGGTHLVYEANVNEVEISEREEAIEGVRDVIERRVNSFGVSEPIVQTTKTGEHWRVIVELAGVHDVNQAINMIGETPLLEFKEVNEDPAPELTEEEKKELEDYNNDARNRAQDLLNRLKSGNTDFVELAKEFSEDEASKEEGGDLGFITKQHKLYTPVKGIDLGRINKELIDSGDGFEILRKDEERNSEDKEVKANHILICYQGAERCERETSQEDARALIDDLKIQATSENFVDLAKQHSTEPGAAERGGDLGFFSKGQMVPEFEQAVFAMEVGQISDVVETSFGYHLIYKADERTNKEYRTRRIFIKKLQEADVRPPQDQFKNTDLSGKQLSRAVVQFDPNTNAPQVGLEFDSEGDKLFEEITERNVGKPLAIFLDGEPISIPRVNQKISGGTAVITGNFSIPEAKLLVRRLNAGALPVPIELLSQQTVGASLGKISIEKSLQAAFAGLLLVALFMILFYRLPGLLAVIALGVYTVIVLAIFKLWPVTLTLSGIAGFILSIGLAVDANVLIFERMKEELRLGKSLGTAIDDGFRRAWTSIRDGNISTLITAFILATFTTSIVKGFAITLSIGVLVSMFTAITITRTFLKVSTLKPNWTWLYGVKKLKE